MQPSPPKSTRTDPLFPSPPLFRSRPDATRKAAMDAYLADPPEGASPAAIGRALTRLARGQLLSADSTQYILGVMSRTHSGPRRLKAGLPTGWTFLHKTGTGQDYKGMTAGYNDIGIATAPDGKIGRAHV